MMKKNNFKGIKWKCNIMVDLKIGLFPSRSMKFHVPSRIYSLFL